MLDFPWQYRFWKEHLTVILDSLLPWPRQPDSPDEVAVPPAPSACWETGMREEGPVDKYEESSSSNLDSGQTDLPRESEEPVTETTKPEHGPEEEFVPFVPFTDCETASGGVVTVETEEQSAKLRADKKREKQRLRRQKQRQERREKRLQEAAAEEADVLLST